MATQQTGKVIGAMSADMLVTVLKPIGTGENSEVFSATILALKNLLGIAPYKSFVALLTQTGTSAPVINVLENNTGITFTASYDDVGAFVLTPDVAPDDNKVTVLGVNASGSGFIRSMFWRLGVINISTVDSSDAPVNGVLSNSTIEIRIYP